MVYSHDAYGLGNISRMLAICQYMLRSMPNISILLVSGSPMLHSFRLPLGLDYIKLPCLNRGQSGQIAVKYLNVDIESTLKLRSEIILAAAKNYQPDLILVDKKPTGIKGELQPTIEYSKTNLPATKFVLLLRDILDTPEKIIEEWQREGYYAQAESFYDRILVVGMQQIFNLVSEYQFNKTIADKVLYCGYIYKESGLKNRRTIQQELGISKNKKLILVTPGGGEDGYFLISNYLQGLAQQNYFTEQNIHTLIFCGAQMPPQQQQQIYQQAKGLPSVTIKEFTNDLMSYINTADLVVSMCGYNTITEVLQKGKKPIVVPRIKPGREQLVRAKSLAKAGLIEMIHPEELEPDLLIRTVVDNLILNKPSNETNSLDFSGLPKVADYLAMLLFDSFNVEEFTTTALKSA